MQTTTKGDIRMKKALALFLILGVAWMISAPVANAGNGPGTGDGNAFFYQWFNDSDGDGIPNCEDEDWIRPEDGTGFMYQIGNAAGSMQAAGTGSGNLFEYLWQHKLQNKGETTGQSLFQHMFEHAQGSK
jgi:hypothetical protein